MKVASDVKNIDGMLMIPAGCELTERQINILQAWGVPDVEVEMSVEKVNELDPLAKLGAEAVAAITSTLRARYWKPDDFGPVPAEIFRLMVLREAQRLLKPVP
jgi:hypothetical protein